MKCKLLLDELLDSRGTRNTAHSFCESDLVCSFSTRLSMLRRSKPHLSTSVQDQITFLLANLLRTCDGMRTTSIQSRHL